AERQETVAHVRRAFQRLPPRLRVTVTMALVEERCYPEIAEAVGVPLGTVKSRVFPAVRILRKNLGRLRMHTVNTRTTMSSEFVTPCGRRFRLSIRSCAGICGRSCAHGWKRHPLASPGMTGRWPAGWPARWSSFPSCSCCLSIICEVIYEPASLLACLYGWCSRSHGPAPCGG